MDNRDEYAYGWNERGQRFHALKSGRREERVNMIAALCNQNLIAPQYPLKERAIEQCLKPGWKVACFPYSKPDRLWSWIMPRSTKAGALNN
jgi:hypothetical protein